VKVLPPVKALGMGNGLARTVLEVSRLDLQGRIPHALHPHTRSIKNKQDKEFLRPDGPGDHREQHIRH
jgi:hypothetical protein